CLHYSSSPWTF
nr:immunoglobulin light chain junction region [Macaca mulatta]MOW39285.1 immunoglobulin light chain junction region [Macaca mulatta]MOW39661.1 immunoglobulin light chain junction region [Macaca mulatta]MOW39782.1 immunoglobulin light chain junction region [Macaca mulatta]MOW39918.1 immunoglobulin light chain junction region [Macaca mulatta]